MATPPARTELADTYPNPSNAVFRTGIGKLWDYVTTLLGATGNQADARTALGIAPAGQCRLTKSGANLLLSRYQGTMLMVNNLNCVIPAAGVTLAATGLTVGTTYFIYAIAAAGVITGLEASTTGHSTDATSGVEIKTGDATRTLVGMARPITGPAWQDATNQRFVISWHNRKPIATLAAFTAARSVAAGGIYAEVNAEIRNEFLTWAETVTMGFDGSVVNSSANGLVNTGIGLDGVSSFLDAWSRFQAYAAGATGPASCRGSFAAAEGYHFTTIAGASSIGTGQWDLAANAAGSRSTLKGIIQG